jgi:selenide,water dikinase
VLVPILADLPVFQDENVLVGFETADDAGVYLLGPETALVATIDFFTPIVDDPATYGQIAAANSLSDVYAMGGRPIFALSVVGFPSGTVETEALREIVHGGAKKMFEAGVPIIGGHSIQDPEMKFGYAVTGLVHPKRLWTNQGAKPGDHLYLTKPLGIGIVTTGVKYGKTSSEVLDAAVATMLELNGGVVDALAGADVHAVTDVTGYGLVGHACELARSSGVTLVFGALEIPVLKGTMDLARKGMLPGGIMTNRAYAGSAVRWEGVDELQQHVFLDPQTSGGLLLSLPGEAAKLLERRLEGRANLIGRVEAQEGDCLIRFE